MSPTDDNVSSFVRSRITSALIGAGLLLYFGFAHLAEPTGSELFHRAAWVFFHTLRIGGLALAAVVVALATGHRLALAADAVIAVAVGLLLVGTGVVMFVDGGGMAQPLINVVCGSGFVSSGRRSWHDYRALRKHSAREGEAAVWEGEAPAEPSECRLARNPATPHPQPPPPNPQPTTGYLAALADEGPPRTGEHQP